MFNDEQYMSFRAQKEKAVTITIEKLITFPAVTSSYIK